MVDRVGVSWGGGCLLSFSKPIESVVSECVVSLTRACVRLMGLCFGAFRGRSCRLFTKTYVSDYDRWGRGQGPGGGRVMQGCNACVQGSRF